MVNSRKLELVTSPAALECALPKGSPAIQEQREQHASIKIMGRRAKSIAAATKKSRRTLEGMQAKRPKAKPITLPEPPADLAQVQPRDLPSLLGKVTIVDARPAADRAKGHLAGSVHVPQEHWDLLSKEARALCECGRRLVFLEPHCAKAAARAYPELDVAVLSFRQCLAELWPGHKELFRDVSEDLEPYCRCLRDRRRLDWAAGLTEEERFAEVKRMHRLPVDVTPTLYLGDAGCAQDVARHKSLFITHVLNCAAGETADWSDAYAAAGITLMAVGAKDDSRCSLLLDENREIEAFLATARDAGAVLVHCVQGLNRSGLVVAAELVRNGADVLDAVRLLRARRGNDALSNMNFQRQLVRYAARLNRLGPAPASPVDLPAADLRPPEPPARRQACCVVC